MIPEYESFLDATPEKGVIVVEYWWQASNRLNSKRQGASHPNVGVKTSMIFFKRILTTAKCWCGSGKAFGKCHRRDDDWSYVSLDPDRQRYSPVVLFERVFSQVNPTHTQRQLANDKRLLCLDFDAARAEWAVPAHPPIVNDIGQLLIGSFEITPKGLRIETNSAVRLDYLTGVVHQLLGAQLGMGETRRADPQKTFAVPGRR